MYNKTLEKIHKQKMTPAEGYEVLYGISPKRGRFLIARFYIFGHPFLNAFLGMIFLFPLPLAIIKFLMKIVRIKKYTEYYELAEAVFSCSRGLIIQAFAHEAAVYIKII